MGAVGSVLPTTSITPTTDDNLNSSAMVNNSGPVQAALCLDTDNNECTAAACVNGACNQTVPGNEGGSCNDNPDQNECTELQCVVGVCTNVAGNEGDDCDDFNGTFDEQCADPACEGGVCVLNAEPTTTECDPEGTFDEECAAPACDGEGGCELNAVANETECTDDGNVCTDDFCVDGFCEHPPFEGPDIPAGVHRRLHLPHLRILGQPPQHRAGSCSIPTTSRSAAVTT